MTVRVMVVDDTQHVRQMLVSMLELDGFEVVAETGSRAEALELIERSDPEVVVVDYKMGATDGLDLAADIRARRPEQGIILYTAYLDAALEERARSAGVAVCVGKIEGIGALERHITELVRDWRRPQPR